jgi:single-strand DNA-binding protein
MALPLITMTGNLTSDPELKFLPQGAARVGFRIACGERKKDATTGEWVDGDTTFINVTCWRNLAENVAESLKKGDTVTVLGRLRSRTVEDPEKGKATYFDVDADDVSVSLRRATAKPAKAASNGSGSNASDVDPWAVDTSTAAPF